MSTAPRIGILETGRVEPDLVHRHGTYPEIFRRLLRPAIPELELETVPVIDGALPQRPDTCDAWLVIGSKHGVYDPLAWIAPLTEFLREARAANTPIIGVCFGHQIMAEAFGGRAEKSTCGWGCGVHRYRRLLRPSWMADAPDVLSFHAHHQDQVIVAPDGTTRLATSEFCPDAMLAYGDPERPDAISIQAHPEFEPAYAADLLEHRRGGSIPGPIADEAARSFGAAVDNRAFARWVARFLALRLGG